MISRFFIDRPIFATVLSVLITLIGGLALWYLPVAQYPRITPPGVSISISYPGASSQVVADTVAAPIEQQVNGVPGMLYMSSQMGNDGTYTLTVTFDIGTDLKTAVVMVTNRVQLAIPQLPIEVRAQGITIRKRTPDLLMIINFFSRTNRHDNIFLSNFATINIKDQLLRVDGVSDINFYGLRDYSIRAWLDPQQLASRSMTALDVAQAIQTQNLDAPVGQIGQPPAGSDQSFQVPVTTLGRLTEPEEFGEIIIKASTVSAGTASRAAFAGQRPSGGGGKSQPPPSPLSLPSLLPSTTTGSQANKATTTTSTSPLGNLGGAVTGGGGSGIGGGTSVGGAMSTGGGTTTGGFLTPTSSASPPADAAATPLTGLSITAGVSAETASLMAASTGVLGGETMGRGPGRPSAALVRLKDVARIELGAQNYNQSCTFDGRPSVGLGVYQVPGTNALEVADRVRAKMEELKAEFPDGVEYDIAYDTTPYIRESIRDVLHTLLEAVALVGAVVLLFLQDWRAMILPMIDVPVSLIGTFAVMALLGYSLNNISLFGLVLAIGIVVDDAIVVLENVERLIATGLDPRSATIKAMDEVTGPILAISLVLCAVFVPCAFTGGITGQFFRQFAVTIAVSTVISAINAITMTPSRAVLIFKQQSQKDNGQRNGKGHLHQPEALPWWSFAIVGGLLAVWYGPELLARWLGQAVSPTTELSWALTAAYFTSGALLGGVVGWVVIRPVNAVLGWFFRSFNRAFHGMSLGYGWTIGVGMRVSLLVLLIYVGLLGLTWWTFQNAPTGFIPQQDQGRLIVNVQLPDGASLEQTKEVVAQVVAVARQTRGVAHFVAISGLSFLLQANSPNFASGFVVLDPFDQRRDPSMRDTAIMARLRKGWREKVKDAQVTVYGSSPIPGLGSAGGFRLIIEDRGDRGMRVLQQQTDAVVRKLRALPGLSSVATQFRSNTPQYHLDIDRTKAASMGVSLNDINQTLDIYLGSKYVNSFNLFGRHWQVTIQAEGQFRKRIEDIGLFQVRNQLGQMVPLGTLVRAREIAGPLSVSRYNLYGPPRSTATLLPASAAATPSRPSSSLTNETLPITMKSEWTELMFLQVRAGNTAFYVFLLSIVSVFLALSALYESWSLPLAVILVVPLCLLCSVSGIRYTGRDVNIFVQIGLVVLVGLASKNAILIVEYARQLHQEGRTCYDATKLASRLRLRPILMTSIAFIIGVVPLMLAAGAGAEMRRSLGIAVFSGMLGVTLFGIFLTPVFFYVIQGLEEVRLFASIAAQRTVSCVLGGLLGALGGYLLGKLEAIHLWWGVAIGACAGAIVILGAFETHRLIRGTRRKRFLG